MTERWKRSEGVRDRKENIFMYGLRVAGFLGFLALMGIGTFEIGKTLGESIPAVGDPAIK